MSDGKKILVLLATYNGQKYLREQIDSILNQKKVQIDILVSDDSSSDNTVNILKEYEKKGNLKYYISKCGSAQKNFYNLINKADEYYDYYALSDQDDIWKDDKIYSAIEMLNKYKNNIPLLYSGVSVPVDEKLNIIKKKNYNHHLIDTFESSLIASNTQGCTIVFNNIFLKKIKNKTSKTSIMHDSWLHKTCLLLGGKVVFDDIPHMYYRQHENNVFASLGKENTLFSKIKNKINSFFNKNSYYFRTKMIEEWIINYKNEISSERMNELKELKKINESIKVRTKVFFSKKYRSPYIDAYLNFLYLLFIKKV